MKKLLVVSLLLIVGSSFGKEFKRCNLVCPGIGRVALSKCYAYCFMMTPEIRETTERR